MYKANLYSDYNTEQIAASEFFIKIFGEFLRYFFGNKKISLFDIGSGCGKVLADVVVGKSGLNFSKVVGIDQSPEMINFSNKKYSNNFISFEVMDVTESIPNGLKGQQFDIGTSFYCIHWINDIPKAFMNVHRMLNDGGLFCGTYLSWHIMFDIWDQMSERYMPYMKNWKDKFSHLLFMKNSDELVRRYLNEAGFEIVLFMNTKKIYFDYKNADFFSKSKKAVMPWMKSMPEHIQEEFLRDQLNVLMSIQDGFDLPRELVYFIARKLN